MAEFKTPILLYNRKQDMSLKCFCFETLGKWEIVSFILEDCSNQTNVHTAQERRCSAGTDRESNRFVFLCSLFSRDDEGETLDPGLHQAHSISLS